MIVAHANANQPAVATGIPRKQRSAQNAILARVTGAIAAKQCNVDGIGATAVAQQRGQQCAPDGLDDGQLAAQQAQVEQAWVARAVGTGFEDGYAEQAGGWRVETEDRWLCSTQGRRPSTELRLQAGHVQRGKRHADCRDGRLCKHVSVSTKQA